MELLGNGSSHTININSTRIKALENKERAGAQLERILKGIEGVKGFSETAIVAIGIAKLGCF